MRKPLITGEDLSRALADLRAERDDLRAELDALRRREAEHVTPVRVSLYTSDLGTIDRRVACLRERGAAASRATFVRDVVHFYLLRGAK
jgi:hypothetical protein